MINPMSEVSNSGLEKRKENILLKKYQYVKNVYSESYCNMHIPNLIRGRKVNHSFLSLLPSLGQ
jgi:hypothetical protein